MKKIAIALALSASLALIACGEEAKKEESKPAAPAPAAAPAAPAAEELTDEVKAKQERFLAAVKEAVDKKCSLKLASLSGSAEDIAAFKKFNAEFLEKFGKINQQKIKAAQAELKSCQDLIAKMDAK